MSSLGKLTHEQVCMATCCLLSHHRISPHSTGLQGGLGEPPLQAQGARGGTATEGTSRQGGHSDSTREDPPHPLPAIRSLLALLSGLRCPPWSPGRPLGPSSPAHQPECKGKIYVRCNIPKANTICCFPLSEANLSTKDIIMMHGIISDN